MTSTNTCDAHSYACMCDKTRRREFPSEIHYAAMKCRQHCTEQIVSDRSTFRNETTQLRTLQLRCKNSESDQLIIKVQELFSTTLRCLFYRWCVKFFRRFAILSNVLIRNLRKGDSYETTDEKFDGNTPSPR